MASLLNGSEKGCKDIQGENGRVYWLRALQQQRGAEEERHGDREARSRLVARAPRMQSPR